MPEYIFFCSKCNIEFGTIQRMNDKAEANCPECLSLSTHRVPQLFTSIDKTPRTLGSISDKRRKEMGEVCYQDTLKKMADERRAATSYKGILPEGTKEVNPTSERPWWRKDSPLPDYSLNKLNPDQKKKFIMEGKKPIPNG